MAHRKHSLRLVVPESRVSFSILAGAVLENAGLLHPDSLPKTALA